MNSILIFSKNYREHLKRLFPSCHSGAGNYTAVWKNFPPNPTSLETYQTNLCGSEHRKSRKAVGPKTFLNVFCLKILILTTSILFINFGNIGPFQINQWVFVSKLLLKSISKRWVGRGGGGNFCCLRQQIGLPKYDDAPT